MSPSWLKSLRGHARSRSESTSSSTSSLASNNSESSPKATFTRRQNGSQDTLDKENAPPSNPYDPSHTPFKRSSNQNKQHQSSLLAAAAGGPASGDSSPPTALTEQQYNANSSSSDVELDESDLFGNPSSTSALSTPSSSSSPSDLTAENPFEEALKSSPDSSSVGSITSSPAMSRQSSQTTASSNSSSSASSGTPDGAIDIDLCIHKLVKDGYAGHFNKRPALTNSEIITICNMAREVVLSQPMLLEVDPSIKVVGDIHGQYHDLLRMFNMCGFPPQSNYLFLGDYVDRGAKGLECILLLLCYKIRYPENFFILRGNHEAAAVTRVYGFFDECRRRTGQVKIWKSFIDVFNCLPVAAIVAGKIFCVHGGLSPHLLKMDQIRQLQRPAEVSEYGLLNDLLWSDPSDTAETWEPNERGVSWAFSKQVLSAFLQKHDLDLVCRAHMVVEDGYEFWADRQLLTVFSAPNYVSQFDNMGAVLSVDEQLVCSFNLLQPLDGAELKREMLRAQQRFSIEQAQTIKEKHRRPANSRTFSSKKFRF